MKKKIDFKDGFSRIKFVIIIAWSVIFLGLAFFQYYTKYIINIFSPFIGGSLIIEPSKWTSPDVIYFVVFYLMLGLIPIFLFSVSGFVDLTKRIYFWFGTTAILIIILLQESVKFTIFFPLGIIIFGFILFKVLDFIKDGFIKD